MSSLVEAALRFARCRLALFCGNRQHSLIDADERAGFLDELRQSLASARRLNCSHLTYSQRQGRRPRHSPSACADRSRPKRGSAACLRGSSRPRFSPQPKTSRCSWSRSTRGSIIRDTRCAMRAPRSRSCGTSAACGSRCCTTPITCRSWQGNLLPTLEANLDAIGHLHIAHVPGRHEPGDRRDRLREHRRIAAGHRLPGDGRLGVLSADRPGSRNPLLLPHFRLTRVPVGCERPLTLPSPRGRGLRPGLPRSAAIGFGPNHLLHLVL